MDCTEARRLIKQGTTPGSRTPQSTQLGFHLAGCADCRTYRERDEALLATLLDAQPLVAPPPAVPATASAPLVAAPPQAQPQAAPPRPRPRPVAPQAARPAQRAQHPLVLVGMAVMLGVPLALLLWLSGIAIRTERNVAAMIVTPALPTSPGQRSTPPINHGLLSAAPPLVTTAQAAIQPPAPPTASVAASAAASGVASAAPSVAAPTMAPTHTMLATPTALGSTATPWPALPSAAQATALPPASEAPAPPPASDAVTILLLGNDRRPDEPGIPRTDAIMLARIDPRQGRVALLSLPRDLWVTIPGYGQNRINAAYVWGETYQAKGGGMGLASTTVSALTGVPIDYVVMADFQGFVGAIDSLGGITVSVDKTLDDPRFPTMDYGYTHAHFEPGPQRMDGVTALTYSRIRHPDSDFARIKRQQAVIIGIGERLRERGDLQNTLAADTITAALRDYVRTDMPQERLLSLVWSLRNLDAAQVEHYTLGADMVSFGLGSDRYAELLVPGALEGLVRRWYGQ